MPKTFLMPLTVSAVVHAAPVAYWAMTASNQTPQVTVFPTYEVAFQEEQNVVEAPAFVPAKPASISKGVGLKKVVAKTLASPEELKVPTIKATPITTNPSPDYPTEAREDGIEGTIHLKLIVNGEGRVVEVNCPPLSPRLACLKDAAIKAAKKWRFDVTGLKDSTQTVTVDVPFEFSLVT